MVPAALLFHDEGEAVRGAYSDGPRLPLWAGAALWPEHWPRAKVRTGYPARRCSPWHLGSGMVTGHETDDAAVPGIPAPLGNPAVLMLTLGEAAALHPALESRRCLIRVWVVGIYADRSNREDRVHLLTGGWRRAMMRQR